MSQPVGCSSRQFNHVETTGLPEQSHVEQLNARWAPNNRRTASGRLRRHAAPKRRLSRLTFSEL